MLIRRTLLVAAVLGAGCGDDAPTPPKADLPVAEVAGDAGAKSDATVKSNDGTLPPTASTATWHRDIAPLVSEKCSSCHKDVDGIAPFSLQNYASAKNFAKLMASAVEAGTMPPFLAQDTADCKPRHGWVADLRLTADQKAKIRDWADHGAPEGEAATATVIVPPRSVKLEKEDVKLMFPPAKVAGTKDLHTCAIVDPALMNDAYVTNRLITAGNAKVLHHVVSYLVQPATIDDPLFGPFLPHKQTKAELEAMIKAQKGVGIGGAYDCFGGPALEAPLSFEILDAWAPGGIPNEAPPNSGQPISKDALVLLDIHYHPTGGAEEMDVGTRLGLTITETPPKYVSRTVLIGNFTKPVDYPQGAGDLLKQPDEQVAEFKIPPNVKDHIEENTWTWKLPLADLKVYGMGTHAHYVARGLRIWVEHKKPNADAGVPDSECLIDTPSWDFNWQRGYGYDATYDTYPVLQDGDVMHIKCNYDNTMSNKFVAKALNDQGKDAPVEVLLGEDTLDEMCLGALGIMYPNTAAAP